MFKQRNKDISLPFMLPNLSIRGRLVRLEEAATTIITKHDYPFPVGKILVELLAVSASLSGLLKYEGNFILQTKTSGPLNLSVVDITHEGHMRGYAQFKPKEITNSAFRDLVGEGHLAFTVDQGAKVERYQGIVSLSHDNLSEAIEHYFHQSEQLETRLYVASEMTDQGVWKSGALLLQQMPAEKSEEDRWVHMQALLKTLSAEEFLNFSIPPETLLHNLFHEVGVTIFDPLTLKAQCRCSAERIKSFLKSLSADEVEELLEKGPLKTTCEFCNHLYEFGRNDLMIVH